MTRSAGVAGRYVPSFLIEAIHAVPWRARLSGEVGLEPSLVEVGQAVLRAGGRDRGEAAECLGECPGIQMRERIVPAGAQVDQNLGLGVTARAEQLV